MENVCNVKIINKDDQPHQFSISGDGLADLEFEYAGPTVAVGPGEVQSIPVRVRVPGGSVQGGADLVFKIETVPAGLEASTRARFIAPTG